MPAYRRGVWEPKQPVCTGWGQGAQDEVNVLQPNNQHVDFFTGRPSSGQSKSLVELWTEDTWHHFVGFRMGSVSLYK